MMIDYEIRRLQQIKELYELIDELAMDLIRASKSEIPIKDIREFVSLFGGDIKTDNSFRPIEKTGRDSFNIYISDWEFPKFRKFEIATKLGDLILHTNYLSDHEAYMDSKEIQFKPERGLVSNVEESKEFAYGLLMPREIFRDIVKQNTKDNIIKTSNVADYFDVSISAASTRGKRLGLIKD